MDIEIQNELLTDGSEVFNVVIGAMNADGTKTNVVLGAVNRTDARRILAVLEESGVFAEVRP